MKKLVIYTFLFNLFQFASYAENQINIDISLDKFNFKKPEKGTGKAGSVIFKTANINNNGIVLNLTNVNNFFDSEIFIRPTFLGFISKFGNYGFQIDEKNILNQINQSELINSKLIFDESQLNLSGEYFSFADELTSLKLSKFRLYCQSMINPNEIDNKDMTKSCFKFLTLNGSFESNNNQAQLELENIDKNTKEKLYINSTIQSLDLRKTEINLSFLNTKVVSNDSYVISTNNLSMNCAKDENLVSMDQDKIKKDCMNRFKIQPLVANIVDNKEQTNFRIDLKNVEVKDQIVYLVLNNANISDKTSTTKLGNTILNCKKELDTDLLEEMDVIRDCLKYARISISTVTNENKLDSKKDNTTQNIMINSNLGSTLIQSDVKFLGISAKVSIYSKAVLDESHRQLILTVTDAKLPFGINSVKLLMYFLKKNIVSKDVSVHDNIITISL